MPMDIPFGTFGDELPKETMRITAIADCENQGRMLHEVRGYQVKGKAEATSSPREPGQGKQGLGGGREEELTFYSDEPPRLGGDGEYPQPLTYIAGGVGT